MPFNAFENGWSESLLIPSLRENVEQIELFTHCWWECKMLQLILKPVCLFPSKAKHSLHLCYNTAFPVLDISQEKWNPMSTQKLVHDDYSNFKLEKYPNFYQQMNE